MIILKENRKNALLEKKSLFTESKYKDKINAFLKVHSDLLRVLRL